MSVNGYEPCYCNCDCWLRKSAGNKMGSCRAKAPVVLSAYQPQQGPNGAVQFIPVVDSFWPQTADYHWCREHQPMLDRDARAKVGSLDSLELPAEGNAD